MLLITLFFFAQLSAVDDPWADDLLESVAIDPQPGFDFPERTLGPPQGGTTAVPNNSAVASLGTAGSYLTLRFDTPVTDDPLNPLGLDCIVFSNAFWTGGNPQLKWCEPALISISQDLNENGLPDDPWYFIPGSRDISPSVLPAGMSNPDPPLAGNIRNPNSTDEIPENDSDELDWGYAELTPSQQEYLDNYLRPDDPGVVGLTPSSGGGDAFDIAWAVDAAGAPASLDSFDFIRIWSFLTGSNGIGSIAPDIDAVADVAPSADADEDGILDEYEERVSLTDSFRAESTVLPLEIPLEEGGSPEDTWLGTAMDGDGNSFSLYSAGTRTGARAFNATVDILPALDPGPQLSGYIKTSARREFVCDEENFLEAQIQDAELTMVYDLAQVSGLDLNTLTPFRFDGAAFTQDGISNVARDGGQQNVRFRSRYPGVFVLAGTLRPAMPGELDEVWVDFAWAGPENGSSPYPFDTLAEAVTAVMGDGTIKIKAGVGAAVGSWSKAMRLESSGGVARLGALH